MIDAREFIKQLLKKKGWTLQQFANEINAVKRQSGIDSTTTKQNISNFLNHTRGHDLRPKMLVVWEKALGLKEDTLVNMVEPVKSKKARIELERIKEKVRK